MGMDDSESLKTYNNIYLEIIMRYKDDIEIKEELHMADLPRLVTPSDESVGLVSKDIQSKFPAYNFEQDFPEAARLAYEYVRNNIAQVYIPIQFWLKPAQTIRFSAGDIFDKAVLLCSILVALGNVSSRIIVVARDAERIFIVYSEFAGRIIAIDVEKGIKEYQNIDELLRELKVDDAENTTAYEFNDKMYRNIV